MKFELGVYAGTVIDVRVLVCDAFWLKKKKQPFFNQDVANEDNRYRCWFLAEIFMKAVREKVRNAAPVTLNTVAWFIKGYDVN